VVGFLNFRSRGLINTLFLRLSKENRGARRARRHFIRGDSIFSFVAYSVGKRWSISNVFADHRAKASARTSALTRNFFSACTVCLCFAHAIIAVFSGAIKLWGFEKHLNLSQDVGFRPLFPPVNHATPFCVISSSGGVAWWLLRSPSGPPDHCRSVEPLSGNFHCGDHLPTSFRGS